MSHFLTPQKNKALTEVNSDLNIIVSPLSHSPTSHKKRSRYEDILYISKSELEKEIKAFISLLASRNSIKETEVSSYIEYLKKGLTNIAVDSAQIENIENFSDLKRSPGHKRTHSSSLVGEHHLKLRNFQLERDRIAYEDKIMNHGKHVLDLEDKISKLIKEYKGVFDEKTAVESEVENLNKQLEISKSLNAALKTNNEGIMKKNANMRKEMDDLLKKVAQLEESAAKGDLDGKTKMNELEEVQKKEREMKRQVGMTEGKIKGIEESLKKEIEEKDKKILSLEETVKRDAGVKRKNEVLQKQVNELEEQIKLDAGLKMKVCAFQQQITVLEEHIKRDVGLRVENESLQKRILELEEIGKNNGENKREVIGESEQSKKSADYIKEIKNLKGQISELKEQAKKDAKLRSEFLAMQKLISELEDRMNMSVDHKREIECQQTRIVELEAQVKRDEFLRRDVEMQKERIFELEEQIKRENELEMQEENDKLDRYAKVLEDMERVKLENEKLTGQLTERETNIKMLENQKEKLLREIGGLIDNNIRNQDEEDVKEPQETDHLIYQNMYLLKDLKEKNVLVKVLREEVETLKQEMEGYRRILRISGVEEMIKQVEQPAQQNQQSNENKTGRVSAIKVEESRSPVGSKSILLLENFESQGTERIQESYERILPKGDILQYEDMSQLYGSMTYDHMKRQVDDYRTGNVLLQKKVESYYLQIEELNNVLKTTNENLDAAQNRCITLQRELQNKCNLEALVQSLLTLINNLEQKIEKLVGENMLLQKTTQDNVIVITNLKNQLKERNAKQGNSELNESGDSKYRGLSSLEKEALAREYEEKIKILAEGKEVELEEERIRNKNSMERYHAHLEVLGRKVQALVSVNEGLGRDLEVLKAEFADYKIVVASILQESITSMDGLKNFDLEIQNIIQGMMEEDKSEGVVRMREVYGMLKKDIMEAKKLLEERKLLI